MGKIGEGKFGEFGESFVIHQTKTIHNSTNLLANLLICQTFIAKYSKEQTCQTFSPPNFPAIP